MGGTSNVSPRNAVRGGGRVDIDKNPDGEGLSRRRVADVDVAVDFTMPDAVRGNLPRYAALA